MLGNITFGYVVCMKYIIELINPYMVRKIMVEIKPQLILNGIMIRLNIMGDDDEK